MPHPNDTVQLAVFSREGNLLLVIRKRKSGKFLELPGGSYGLQQDQAPPEAAKSSLLYWAGTTCHQMAAIGPGQEWSNAVNPGAHYIFFHAIHGLATADGAAATRWVDPDTLRRWYKAGMSPTGEHLDPAIFTALGLLGL